MKDQKKVFQGFDKKFQKYDMNKKDFHLQDVFDKLKENKDAEKNQDDNSEES